LIDGFGGERRVGMGLLSFSWCVHLFHLAVHTFHFSLNIYGEKSYHEFIMDDEAEQAVREGVGDKSI
jgi:hypothetical protein